MTVRRTIGVIAAGLVVSLAAQLFLHHAVWPGILLLSVVLSASVTLAVRRGWSDLPDFVTVWLDLGVTVVAALVIIASTGLTQGIAYGVLRWPRTVAILGTASMLGGVVGGLAYTHRRLEVEVRSAAQQLAIARRRALESRLTALAAQINPHFLFNTLNTLAEVVHEDEDEAEELVSDLAAMMRYALDHSATRVCLGEEMGVLRRLLRIEHARLGDRFAADIDVAPEVEEALIPGLLVQPLLENAVQHGVARRVDGGRVSVHARPCEAGVEVVVADDGPGLPDTILAGLDAPLAGDAHPGGLRNVKERLLLTWPEATFTVEGPGTRVVLTFPLETT